jgi:hypothetical protein
MSCSTTAGLLLTVLLMAVFAAYFIGDFPMHAP